MNRMSSRALGAILAGALFAAAPLDGQAARPAKKSGASSAASAASPRVQVGVESVLDRRTSGDFPSPSLTVTLKLDGEDAAAIRSVKPRVSRAVDDGGKNLTEGAVPVIRGSGGWQPARGEGAPQPQLDLASPSRKAKTIALEGVLEAYLPARDPSASIRVDRIAGRRDKPVTAPALAAQHIQLHVLSKAGLEREKKQAEARKKAEAAKKGKKDGIEAMGEALGDTLTNMLEMLFTTAGNNDLILKVSDPGKKLFGFDLAGPDGAAIESYGTTEYGDYRIVRMLEPIPPNASLVVRLKTPRSFAEIPFTLNGVKLP
jgi:hypothetical protein